jgi:hypothetical protein
LLTIFAAAFITNAVFSNVTPLLPIDLEEKGVKTPMMKAVYSMISVSNVIGALVTGKRAHKI